MKEISLETRCEIEVEFLEDEMALERGF